MEVTGMELHGKSVFGGIAIGRISVHKKDEQQVKRVRIEDSEQEILRYRQAKQTAMEQLQGLYQKALKEVGEANAAIFEIHQMMLEDDDYNESVENIIRMQQVNAAYAASSSSPSKVRVISLPALTARPMIPKIRLQSPLLPSLVRVILAANSLAAFTSSPAGRA